MWTVSNILSYYMPVAIKIKTSMSQCAAQNKNLKEFVNRNKQEIWLSYLSRDNEAMKIG